jgi:hypothetical protein
MAGSQPSHVASARPAPILPIVKRIERRIAGSVQGEQQPSALLTDGVFPVNPEFSPKKQGFSTGGSAKTHVSAHNWPRRSGKTATPLTGA